ncbi:MAG: SPOR domain-containing protein [Bacteroidales bacterium]|nr:SPOR domain-containing protein [Bacteroidales bacterium]
MRIFFVLILLITGFCFNIFAQDTIQENIEIIQDNRIDSLVQIHIKYNESQDGIPGFRVQVFFDSGNFSHQNAMKVIEKFNERYEDVPAYISWKAPNYRVRVGDFRSRLEAEGFLAKIKYRYPSAFVIPSKINFPKVEF